MITSALLVKYLCVKHAGEVLVCAARATRQNRRFVALTLTCVVPRRGPPRGAEGHHVLLCRRRLARAPRRAVESGKLGRHRLWQSVHIRLGDGLHEMNRVPGPRTVRAIYDQQRKRDKKDHATTFHTRYTKITLQRTRSSFHVAVVLFTCIGMDQQGLPAPASRPLLAMWLSELLRARHMAGLTRSSQGVHRPRPSPRSIPLPACI